MIKDMKTYIKKNHKGFYIQYDEELDAEYWAGQIGETLADFFDGKWVLLSDEQAAFHEEHPDASLDEVWNMTIKPAPERTIGNAKQEMIAKIEEYDASENVNSFNVKMGPNTFSAWFTPAERSNYKSSIDAAELIGVNELSFYIGNNAVTLPTETAKLMLAQIQLYADQCFIVTKKHETAVRVLTSIENVDNYDYTTGYPEKLQFDLV